VTDASPETIIEWIAFHVLQGVDYFYIYDNANNYDVTREGLKDWILAGYVQVIDWPPETLGKVLPAEFIR